MSISCPRCDGSGAWRLADGRYRCKSCRSRFSNASIWRSFRIADSRKALLLERFVFGTPIRRQRFRPAASAPTAERFYRAIRAYCLLETARCTPAHAAAGTMIAVTDRGAFVVGSRLCPGKLPLNATTWQTPAVPHQIHGVEVVPCSGDETAVGAFLAFGSHWIDIWGQYPGRSTDLLIAEICWRFNHRDSDVFRLLLEGLKKTSRNDVSAILASWRG